MFVFHLGSLDNPLEYIEVEEYFFNIISLSVDNKLIPACLEILICDLYGQRKFEVAEAMTIYEALTNECIDAVFDDETLEIIKKLKEMFSKSIVQNHYIFGVGD